MHCASASATQPSPVAAGGRAGDDGYIGGTNPSLPTEIRFAITAPCAARVPNRMIRAPGTGIEREPGSKITTGVFGVDIGRCRRNEPGQAGRPSANQCPTFVLRVLSAHLWGNVA